MKKESSYMAYMFALLIIAIITVAVIEFLVLKAPARSSTTTISNMNHIIISASGTVSNASSQAILYVVANGTGSTNKLAVQNISATLEKFNSTIPRYVNGNLSKISTEYFNVYKNYNRTGYTVEEGLEVIIPNIKNVSGAIGSLSNISNIYVTGAYPQLSDSQISAMRVQALSLAMSNATAQAQALVGRNNTIYTTNISVNNYYIFPVRYGLGVASASVAPGASVQKINNSVPAQFYGGTNKITESVAVIFTYGRK